MFQLAASATPTGHASMAMMSMQQPQDGSTTVRAEPVSFTPMPRPTFSGRTAAEHNRAIGSRSVGALDSHDVETPSQKWLDKDSTQKRAGRFSGASSRRRT
jgi:hypothetical protein